MPARTVEEWFAAYGVCHQDARNKLIHWVCVPAIMLSIFGLAWEVPVPAAVEQAAGWFHWTHLLMVLALLFYVTLSLPLAVGMALVCAVQIGLIWAWDRYGPTPVWAAAAGIFVAAWIVQFIGHKIEGAKPAFFEDLQFLLIGPLWLLGFVYRRLGVRY